MNETLPFSKEGVDDIIKFLEKKPYYIVKDIQDDLQFRKVDIDLLLIDNKDINNPKTHKIEVKTDRYYNTYNYFFETISNKTKNTTGCFLYSEADYLFYYFQNEKELHMLPFKKTRKWFCENKDRFQTKYPATRNNKGQILYRSEGKIVPRSIVRNEVDGIVVKYDILDFNSPNIIVKN